ncbi:hypothetical protein VTL71DRAFT_5283 [Oculimacula yallundae]|uniref:Uncharacterized protein n=1 Tax=Oculimacula yallundae TaxID=86028 RepID=A0ABR4C0M7_9HELO
MRAIPIAKAQNVDLVSEGTAFRQWLDKGLLWRVEETLEAMLDPKTDLRIVAALADSRNPDHGGKWQKFIGKIGCRPEGFEPYVKYQRCNMCKTELLGIFYAYHDIFEMEVFNNNNSRLSNLTCLGCQLRRFCISEKDHNKDSKRRLMKAWLHSGLNGFADGEWNSADLTKALSDFHTRRIIFRAYRLDDRRDHYMNHTDDESRHYDHEYDARQKRIPWETYGKHGFQKRSPTADIPEKKGPLDNWTSHSMDNRNAHFRCH